MRRLQAALLIFRIGRGSAIADLLILSPSNPPSSALFRSIPARAGRMSSHRKQIPNRGCGEHPIRSPMPPERARCPDSDCPPGQRTQGLHAAHPARDSYILLVSKQSATNPTFQPSPSAGTPFWMSPGGRNRPRHTSLGFIYWFLQP